MTTIYNQELEQLFPTKTGAGYWGMYYQIKDAITIIESDMRCMYEIDTEESYNPAAYELICEEINKMTITVLFQRSGM